MAHTMSFRRYTRIFYVILMLLVCGAGEVWALTTEDIIIDGPISNGSVTAKSTEAVAGGTLVTITVTPNTGYYVKKSDIIVQKLVAPSAAQARRRVPDIANTLAVTGPSSSSSETDYTFVVPSDYAGALVTVTFTAMPPATATVTPNSLTYTGEAQELVTLEEVVGGAASNPVTYSLSSDGPYSTTIPTRTNAGTYTVYYKVAGDDIHAEGSGSVSVTIQKAALSNVTLGQSVQVSTGSELTFTVSSVKAGTVVVPEGNYTVSGNKQTAIGNYILTVTAVEDATHINFTGSATASYRIVDNDYKIIYSNTPANEVANLAGKYILEDDFENANVFSNLSSGTFTGTFDGNYHKISGLTSALFNTINGGTVKNVMLDNVTISSGTNVGAICNEAYGSTKIYNCGVLSGTVSGSGSVGGLVGLIRSGSSVRVVNCYSYANVSGGSTMAGIVGNNQGSVGDVRIAMCMMYGNMSGGTSPVYAGNHTSNAQNFTEYNYWRSRANLTYTTYNDQLAIDKDEYLTRFPFYRHILNTHRELASYFLFGDYSESHVDEIGHWVLKRGENAPLYPVIEQWAENTKKITVDLKNNVPNTTDDRKGKLLATMGSSGYLTVNVYINGSKVASPQLPITDMNEDQYDYTWGKVVLPFANEFSGWTRDYSKVCTGWEITSISGGTLGTFEHYDVANRNCTAKDLYANSNYIFAQGGYYIVPYGVTSININAHFANAFYLSDASYDVGYDASFNNPTALGGSVSGTYHSRTVYTDLTTLVSDLATTNNPHDQAIVLVGNFHYFVKNNANQVLFNTNKAVTIMSTDEDNNQEPDYGWYMGDTYGRLNLPPIRFDFVPIIEYGMALRVNSTTTYPGLGIWHTRGWFEQTETCVSFKSQCEITSHQFNADDDGKGNNRWIINSGYFIQIVRSKNNVCDKLSYIQVGGNAYVKELYPGNHTDNNYENIAVPIIVTGGQVDECYMTGYKTGGKLKGDIYFWCAGGKIKKFLGAYLDEPVAKDSQPGNMTASVDHALIGRFFGGGTSASARIKGNIDVTINNSQVDFYCGGPEFGDMYTDKTVTTHATNTIFGEFYGAGYGGTSITYNREAQDDNVSFEGATAEYNLGFSYYTNKRLGYKTNYGIGTCYKFEYIYHSSGSKGVARFYTGYAKFSLAKTGNVTNVLNNCQIKELPASSTIINQTTSGDFYGAGCQGMVNGTVSSTLTGCSVEGSAFGGGYKAANNAVDVYPTTQPSYSIYTKETGLFSEFGTVAPETYEWIQGDASHDEVAGTGANAGKLYTSKDIDMTTLGNVTGAISITIDGGYVGGTSEGQTPARPATATSEARPAGGSVYGGGNESKSLNNTTVTLQGNAEVYGNVFGGGNHGVVSGSATVNIEE